ncbi:MAG: DUF4186 family protein [Clostridiales bacterium]|nr:DUF4186 family protein [Clostridiales bacterium]
MNEYDPNLKITCTMTDCENDKHCYRTNKTLQKKGVTKGSCRYCKNDFIDWDRLYKKDLNDIEYTVSAFKMEMIRHMFWDVKKPPHESIIKVTKLSEEELKTKIRSRIVSSIGKTLSENAFDGRQTPLNNNNLVHWSQHATGTCCRICLDQWYGIDPESKISAEDFDYLTEICFDYIERVSGISYE